MKETRPSFLMEFTPFCLWNTQKITASVQHNYIFVQ